MVHITSFEIQNLNGRSLPLAKALNRDVNVLFGSNGSGKTSILKIIDSALSLDASVIANTSFSEASVRLFSVNQEKEITFRYRKSTDSSDSGDSRKVNRNLLVRPSEVIEEALKDKKTSWIAETDIYKDIRIPRRWAHIYLPTTRLYTQSQTVASSGLYYNALYPSKIADYEATIDKGFAEVLQQTWTIKYGAIMRRIRSIQDAALQAVFLNILEVGTDHRKKTPSKISKSQLDASKAFERMSSFLQRQPGSKIRQVLGSKEQFAQRYGSEPRLRQIVEQIDQVEANIEEEMRPIQVLSDLIKRLFSQGKSISFDGPRITVESDRDEQIGLEGLSSGEKHLVRILVAAIEAEENTMIVDEPELSLHIDWQRDLIKNIHLLNPSCQLIFATHSPEIMAEISDESIFRI